MSTDVETALESIFPGHPGIDRRQRWFAYEEALDTLGLRDAAGWRLEWESLDDDQRSRVLEAVRSSLNGCIEHHEEVTSPETQAGLQKIQEEDGRKATILNEIWALRMLPEAAEHIALEYNAPHTHPGENDPSDGSWVMTGIARKTRLMSVGELETVVSRLKEAGR